MIVLRDVRGANKRPMTMIALIICTILGPNVLIDSVQVMFFSSIVVIVLCSFRYKIDRGFECYDFHLGTDEAKVFATNRWQLESDPSQVTALQPLVFVITSCGELE